MPIVYVHGVANREDEKGNLAGWDEIQIYLQRYIAPEISSNPGNVAIELAYWGKYGADFRWGGLSRPRTKLRAAGAAAQSATPEQLAQLGGLEKLPEQQTVSMNRGGLSSGRVERRAIESKVRLRDLTPDELSAVLCSAIEQNEHGDGGSKIVADDVARDPAVQTRIAAADGYDSELLILRDELRKRQAATARLAAQGGSNWWDKIVDRVDEVVTRVDSAPGYALSRAAVEFRGPVNEAITTFFGDVFSYMSQRNDNPGTIRGAVLEALRKAKSEAKDPEEPMIVVSHSMGALIVFDLATSYLAAEGIRIDFWAAAASQVGLFEELKLLLASDPNVRGPNGRASFPPNVGWWWNVWDTNDVLSYTVRSIFDISVDDEEWDSGASLAAAHGAYLHRPGFYRRFADRIKLAKAQNFNRP